MSDATLFYTTDHLQIFAHPEPLWLGGWMDGFGWMWKSLTNPKYTSFILMNLE